MGLGREVESFIENYLKSLEDGNAAIFAGAGLSVPSGYVDWRNLLRNLAKEIDLDVDKEHDLASLTQYFINERGRSGVDQLLTEVFCGDREPNENHRILSALPISTYWTTNYDDLIETSLRNYGKSVQVKSNASVLHTFLPKRDAEVYKMHGDRNCLPEAVIAKYDYEKYLLKNEMFATLLKADLFTKTFLLIGFSFEDPNINYILGNIHAIAGERTRIHYWFERKPLQKACESSSEYNYRLVKFKHRIKDLQCYSIRAVVVDSYEQITEILKILLSRYNASKVFISGSAHRYESYEENDVDAFIYELSKELIKKDYKIISGFGKGIGSSVINGSLAGINEYRDRDIKSNLILRPFPQNIVDLSKRKYMFTKYREDMLSEAGVAIFMFGNKLSQKESTIVEADGVLEEYSIAKKRGVKVIALGCTGGAAKKIWEEQMAEFETYFPSASYPGLKSLYEKLGEKDVSLEECKKLVLEILDTVSGRHQSK